MLEQNAAKPLYEQLMDAVEEDIRSGRYQFGDRLPTETEMEAIYHVSRITVRRAVKELCDRKILEKKQGKGTFVRSETVQSNMSRIAGFHESLAAQGRRASQRVLMLRESRPDAEVAQAMQLTRGEKVLELRRLFFIDEKPVNIDSCYLPLDRFPCIRTYMTGDFSVYAILRERYGVQLIYAKKEIRTRKARLEEAQLMNCRPGDAVFDTLKTVYDERGRVIHSSRTILNGAFSSYVIETGNQGEIHIKTPYHRESHIVMKA